MPLTVDILDRLHANDTAGAAALVQNSDDGVALIELLEMLWNIDSAQASPLIAPVLRRLEQLRPRE